MNRVGEKNRHLLLDANYCKSKFDEMNVMIEKFKTDNE